LKKKLESVASFYRKRNGIQTSSSLCFFNVFLLGALKAKDFGKHGKAKSKKEEKRSKKLNSSLLSAFLALSKTKRKLRA
jgi:hypothetical protein